MKKLSQYQQNLLDSMYKEDGYITYTEGINFNGTLHLKEGTKTVRKDTVEYLFNENYLVHLNEIGYKLYVNKDKYTKLIKRRRR